MGLYGTKMKEVHGGIKAMARDIKITEWQHGTQETTIINTEVAKKKLDPI